MYYVLEENLKAQAKKLVKPNSKPTSAKKNQ